MQFYCDPRTEQVFGEDVVLCFYPDSGVGSMLQQTFDCTQTEVGGSDVESCTIVEITARGVHHCGEHRRRRDLQSLL